MPKFIAVENGTLTNPYRFVARGEAVELTKEQAKLYEKSRWLRPYPEGKKKIDTPPFFPGVRMVGGQDNAGFTALDAINQAGNNASSEQYNAQMKAIKEKEDAEDGKTATVEPSGEAAQEGTGNLDPIG